VIFLKLLNYIFKLLNYFLSPIKDVLSGVCFHHGDGFLGCFWVFTEHDITFISIMVTRKKI